MIDVQHWLSHFRSYLRKIVTIRSEIPVRKELERLGRSRSESVWLGERSQQGTVC